MGTALFIAALLATGIGRVDGWMDDGIGDTMKVKPMLLRKIIMIRLSKEDVLADVPGTDIKKHLPRFSS